MALALARRNEAHAHEARLDAPSYYDKLCDPDFYGRLSYRLETDRAAVIVAKPGIPLWNSGRNSNLDAPEHAVQSEASDSFPALAALLRLEDAYRCGDDRALSRASQEIATSGDVAALARCAKINRAARARALIESESVEHLSHRHLFHRDRAVAEVLALLARLCGTEFEREHWTADDVFVEAPVRKDFLRRGVDIADRQGLLSFYGQTLAYVFELTAANMQVETLSNYMSALEACGTGSPLKVLDYAGGIGTFTILAAAHGLQVDFAELESVTGDYARERFRNRPGSSTRIQPHIIRHDGDVPDGRWDVVVCTEVLEHVFEPFALLNELLDRLRPGGTLIVSESFDHINDFCTHLPQHEGLGGNAFKQQLNNVRGLTPLLLEPACHVQAWRKHFF